MKRFNLILVALLGLVLISGVTYGQRGGGKRGPGKGRPDSTHVGSGNGGGPSKPLPRPNGPFGLSDSCFRVFLSMIPADQAGLLTNDLAMMHNLDSVGRELRKQLKAAIRAKDSAAVASLKEALKANFDAMVGLEQEIRRIIETNQATLKLVRQECMGFAKRDTTIKHPKDSTDDHGKGPKDSTGGNGGGKDPGNGGKGPGNGGKDTSTVHVKISPVAPNPVRVDGTIKFLYGVESVAGGQVQVSIAISDAMGNLVKTVVEGMVDPGTHEVSVDLTGIPAGIYIVRLQAGTQVCSQKLVIQ